jgi:hypothetical protein
MHSLTRPAPRVKPATVPATGTLRWALQPTDTHPGCLVITSLDRRTGKPVSTAYLVSSVLDNGRLIGWTLKKTDGTAYDLPADLSSCDCPDACFRPERPGGCRHMKALAAGLKALAN